MRGCEGQMCSHPQQPFENPGARVSVGGIWGLTPRFSASLGNSTPQPARAQRRAWPFLPALEDLRACVFLEEAPACQGLLTTAGPLALPRGSPENFLLFSPPWPWCEQQLVPPESLSDPLGDRWHFRATGEGLAGLREGAAARLWHCVLPPWG